MTEPSRIILHADMDAFYAAIEQRDDPALRGKPVIVGGEGKRGVVSTCSYEARKFGVHSAMPGAEAKRRCPDGIFVPPRIEVYAAVSSQVMAVFRSVTPVVEPLSLDEAFLDVTGSQALFGDGPTIAARIRREVLAATGLTVSIGVATSKFVAKVASDLDKPDGLVVVPRGREREFLAPLPIKRLWGAGKVTQQRLEAQGFRRIGDIQRCSREEFERRIGGHAAEHFWSLAHAQDPRAVEAEREAKSVGNERTFGDDVEDPDLCRSELLAMSERVGRRLRKAGLRGRVVRLKLRFPPFETLSRQVTLDAPTDDDLTIYRAVAGLFDQAHSDRPVRLLGVTVASLGDGEPADGEAADGARQLELFGPGDGLPPSGTPIAGARGSAGADAAEPKREGLNRALDALRDRFGDDVIRHGGASGAD